MQNDLLDQCSPVAQQNEGQAANDMPGRLILSELPVPIPKVCPTPKECGKHLAFISDYFIYTT